jgi:hypothetical protein
LCAIRDDAEIALKVSGRVQMRVSYVGALAAAGSVWEEYGLLFVIVIMQASR